MSNDLLRAALNSPALLSPTERLVLALLADRADADGTARLPIGQLAKAAQLSPDTATRALDRLRNLDLVESSRSGPRVAVSHRLTLDGQTDGAPA
ncbi:helix-turn-helix domain-containing protein [Streptomyces sp. NPDC003314]